MLFFFQDLSEGNLLVRRDDVFTSHLIYFSDAEKIAERSYSIESEAN